MLKWAAILLMALPAFAGEDEHRPEIENARLRVKHLVTRGEELAKAGRHDEAEEHFRMAKELSAKLDAIEGKNRKRKKRKKGGDHKQIVNDLEHGIRALKRLGRHDLAEELVRIAKDVIGDRKRHHREEDERARGHNKEIEVAKKQLKVMRYAVEAFVEAGRKDSAELMERAEHALRLRIEGRRDREAQEVYEARPSRGQQIELLAYASELYQDWGKKERAAACRWFADQMRGVEKRVRARRVEGERRREHDGRRHRERREHDRRRVERDRPHPPMERVEALEKRLRHLERMLEELMEEMEEREEMFEEMEEEYEEWERRKKNKRR